MRTYYIITNMQVFAGVMKALATLCVLLCFSCSNSSTLSELEEENTDSTDPMTFSCQLTQGEVISRASTLLTTGFAVSTYKAYATNKQSTVMDYYQVEYKTVGSAWNGTEQPYWDYTGVMGQYEKYWDYSHFPYRFHAVAPFPTAGSVSINDKNLRIQAPYQYQTCLNGSVQPSDEVAEPYIVAQLHRDTDGKDHDILALNEENSHLNNGSTIRHREVWMPFHHLNSKIRFAVYSVAPWASANALYIEGLTVNVACDNFAATATGYQATCSGTGTDADPYKGWRIDPPYTSSEGFRGLTYAANGSQLFRFDGGKEVPGNDLRECQTQKTAFFMQCQEGFMQLPQKDIKLSVTFNVRKSDGTLYQSFTNVPVEYEWEGTYHPLHTWLPGYIYTYYLVLGRDGNTPDKLKIEFTCTLTPWDDVSGSLSTDLEQ